MGVTNPVYAPLFSPDLSPAVRYIDIWGGRGRGGSYFVTDYFLDCLIAPVYFRGYFMRAIYSDIRDSLWRDLKDRVAEREEAGTLTLGYVKLNDGSMTAECPATGNLILSKGFRKSSSGQTAKLKSLAGATAVAIEECEEITEDEFDQLDGSFRTTKAKIRIFRVFNPPKKNHWLLRNHYNLTESKIPGYYVAKPRAQPELLSLFSRYYENAANVDATTIQNYESYRLKKPDYYWTVIRGLVSEGAKGRVYSGWIPITAEQYNALPYPESYGLDFGFGGDPCALVAVKTHNKRRYKRPLLYQPGLLDSALGAKLKALGVASKPIFADSSEPKAIATLKAMGLNIVGVAKPNGSIRQGVKDVSEYENYYVDDDENYTFEYQEYRWELDANKNPTDQVKLNQTDHYLDADRYQEIGSQGRVVGNPVRVSRTSVRQTRL